MSLPEISLKEVTKRQYVYKLKSCFNAYLMLMLEQIIGIFISMSGVFSNVISNEYLTIAVKTVSPNVVFILTMITVFGWGIALPAKPYQQMDLTIPATRLSSSLSNIGFLLTFSVIGGITAVLSGGLLRIMTYLSVEHYRIIANGFSFTFNDLMFEMVVVSLYMVLVGAIGYFAGQIFQIHPSFMVIIPTFIIGLLIVNPQFVATIESVASFYLGEKSFSVFAIKVIVSVLLFFGFSLFFAKDREGYR